jgi:hypothetical protein
MSARSQTSLQNAIKNLFVDVNENFKEEVKFLLHYWTSQAQSQQLIHVRVDVNLGCIFKLQTKHHQQPMEDYILYLVFLLIMVGFFLVLCHTIP